jgi:hypothetical protein
LRRLTGVCIAVVVALLLVGCSRAGTATGTVDGHFSLPGTPAADLRRAGLNFSRGAHGHGHGDTVRIDSDGRYTVALAPGSYSAIGALSGSPPETSGATINVVVTAHKTTRADFVCHLTPAEPSH